MTLLPLIPLRLSKLVVRSDVQPFHILSSRPALLDCFQQTKRGFLQCLKVLFVSIFHANIKAWSRKHEVQKNSATGAWKHEQR